MSHFSVFDSTNTGFLLLPTSPACSWSTPPAEISPSDWLLLSTLYDRPEEVDLFVGALAEATEDGDGDAAAVGPTFACIIARQFEALKDGDRSGCRQGGGRWYTAMRQPDYRVFQAGLPGLGSPEISHPTQVQQ